MMIFRLLLVLLIALNLQAQSPELVANINQGSDPLQFNNTGVVLNNKFITRARLNDTEREELYSIDINTGSVALIKDIHPTPGIGSDPSGFILVDDYVYFTATRPEEGREIWRTDGTPSGTVLVADINTGASGSFPGSFILLTPTLVAFVAETPATGKEMFVLEHNDVIGSITYQVIDIVPGTGSSLPSNLTLINQAGLGLVFSAITTADGSEPWNLVTFPSLSVARLADIHPGANSSSPRNFIYLPNVSGLLMTATGAGFDNELHLVTALDTFVKLNISVSGGSSPSNLTKIANQNKVVFSANVSGFGSEPWVTDGTEGGTFLLKDVEVGSVGSAPSSFRAVGNKVVFSADNNTVGEELYTTDGTTLGTTLLDDLRDNELSSLAQGFKTLNNELFFTAFSSEFGRELFKTDGDVIELVGDIEPGIFSSVINILGGNNTKLLATYDRGSTGEIYGVTNSAIQFIGNNLPTTPRNSSPEGMQAIGTNGNAIFFAKTRKDGIEPYVVTPSGAVTYVGDIRPGSESFFSGEGITLPNGKALFFGVQDDSGEELWVSDGTFAGTQLLKDIRAGVSSGGAQYFTLLGDNALFAATTSTTGKEVWKTDGTPTGTVPLAELNPGVADGVLSEFVKFGNHIYFSGTTPATGQELFRTDGSTIGLVEDFRPGTDSFQISKLTTANNHIYFVGSVLGVPALYSYDGNVISLINDTLDTLDNFVVAGNNVFFTASTPALGNELYVIKNNVVSLVKDIRVGSDDSYIQYIQPLDNGSVTLMASTDEFGDELWVSDGTNAGTVRLTDLQPGSESTSLDAIGVGNGKTFYQAQTDALGYELLETDGTVAGTKMYDINPGAVDSNPYNVFDIAGRIYFSAEQGNLGEELFRIVYDDCLSNPSKTAPGVCGCGIPDDDSNINGVIDCLVNPELVALISDFQKKMKKVSLKTPTTQKELNRLNKATRKARLAHKAVIQFIKNNTGFNVTTQKRFNAAFKAFRINGKLAFQDLNATTKLNALRSAGKLKKQIVL